MAEWNYNVGNRELLEIKMASEEWQHLLEGTPVPFFVWTDHKNLEYIRRAKVNFTLSYWPGTKNIKPGALSQRDKVADETNSTFSVLTPSCGLKVGDKVRQAAVEEGSPSVGLMDHLYGVRDSEASYSNGRMVPD